MCFFLAACSDDTSSDSAATSTSIVNAAGSWDTNGKPVNGGPKGADGSMGNNLTRGFCAHNEDPKCPTGTYLGPHVATHPASGFWDGNGNPVKGGPTGADGSTGNNKTQAYCARNQDPACPKGSFVAADAIRNPNGSNSYVKCEGTVCTNPNHGGGPGNGAWDAAGRPVNGGPQGADGSEGNNKSQAYCAQNQDPACPSGSYVAPKAIPAPDGSNRYVPCEGTVCTNPNNGAGNDPGADDTTQNDDTTQDDTTQDDDTTEDNAPTTAPDDDGEN
ncbi:Mesocentin [Gordonia sp. NPDC003422]